MPELLHAAISDGPAARIMASWSKFCCDPASPAVRTLSSVKVSIRKLRMHGETGLEAVAKQAMKQKYHEDWVTVAAV